MFQIAVKLSEKIKANHNLKKNKIHTAFFLIGQRATTISYNDL